MYLDVQLIQFDHCGGVQRYYYKMPCFGRLFYKAVSIIFGTKVSAMESEMEIRFRDPI